MGGLGKTALVRNVYMREKDNFPANAWIAVSQNYNVQDLLRNLLREITKEKQPPLANMDIYEVQDEINKKMKDTKCLIVLDDVWDYEAYIEIRNALQNLQESRIVITTRKEDVASLASSK
ncbi:hypothetical protein ABZP36_009456 [Zizania latifolia]